GGARPPRAAARPAGGARDLGVPRVPRRAAVLVGPPPAHRKLDRVGLANDDETGGDELLRQSRRIGRAPLAPYLRPAGRDPPLDLDQVFEGNRNAVQRPDPMP